jgi:hypothetical protein
MTTDTSGSGRAAVCIVTRFSISARIATAAIGIAARSAGTRPARISGGALTAGISIVKKDGWTIATANAPTGIAAAPHRRA